jgi:hypothetical protein
MSNTGKSAAVASTSETRKSVEYLSRLAQARRYSKHPKTIKRWGKDPKMGMPPEYDFNGPHRRLDDLERWERSRVALGDSDTE